ncbi:hypothetical protein AAFP35_09050 [Gordonia sp. CPCC 206044]|uniref:hypothetical protein n=1 Tax=Gordonia sp. CPCC 206044 TaxID=3140793 RepID=UPI003AF3A3A1
MRPSIMDDIADGSDGFAGAVGATMRPRPREVPQTAPPPDDSGWTRSPAPAAPAGVRETAGRVRSDREMWLRRARTADASAARLTESLTAIQTMLDSNYLGTDCLEGIAFRTAIRDAVVDGGWSVILRGQIQALNELARNCRAAATSFETVDTQLGSALIR